MKKVPSNQKNSIIYLMSRPLFLGIGFTRIINKVGYDVWISILIGTFISLLINYIFKRLPEEANKYFKIGYNYVLLCLGTLIISKLISSIYLNFTPSFLVMLPFIIIIYYSAQKGKSTLYKVASIIIIINLIVLFVTCSTLIPTIHYDNFLPIGMAKPINIMIGALDYAIISSAPYITISNFNEEYNYKYYLLSSLSMLILFMIVVGSLGVNVASLYRYPEYIIFKKISLLSFIENIENIIFCAWIFDIYILCSMAALNIKKEINNLGLAFLLLLLIIFGSIYSQNIKAMSFFILEYPYLLGGSISIYILNKLITHLKKTKIN